MDVKKPQIGWKWQAIEGKNCPAPLGGEPKVELCPLPGEVHYPARRWVVERTFSWLAKRRTLRTRWCKKAANWLALLQFASAHLLFDMAFFG